ncbi:hypothetical protein ACWFR1_12080 [Streptomyces sp. NPDC055103]
MDDATPTGQEAVRSLPDPHMLLTSETEQSCPECRKPTLGIVTVTVSVGFGPDTKVKPIGGWALCTNCHAAPHPVMERADHG